MLAPGTILVADRSAQGGTGALVAVDPLTGAQQVVSSGGAFVKPSGVAVEADGNILVVDSDAFDGAGGLIRVDPSTGAQTTLSKGGLLQRPFAAAIEADGHIVAASAKGAAVTRVDPATGLQRRILPRDIFEDAVDVEIALDGSILVVANVRPGGALFRIDPVSGQATPVSGADFFNLGSVAASSDGMLWVLEDRPGVGSSVVRFDPERRQSTLISAQGLLHGPFNLALEGEASIVVANRGDVVGVGRVIRITRRSGAQSIVSDGGVLVEPFGVAIV